MKRRFPLGIAAATVSMGLLPRTSQAAAPVVTTQPQPVTVTTGQQAHLSVSYNSTCGTIVPQWQFNGVNIQDGAVYSGTNTGTLTVNATATQRGSYRVVLTCANGGGTTNSISANLVVRATSAVVTLPPMISNLGFSGCSGSACTIWWNGTNGAINATKLTLTPMGGTPVDVTGLTQTTVSPATSTIYTLTASNSAGTYAQNIFVPVGSYTPVSSCGTINAPGNYLITSSISSVSSSTPCLDVRDANNVFIDCVNGVTVSGLGGNDATETSPATSGAINVTNVNGFAIRGCKVSMAGGTGRYFVNFANSSMGYIYNSTFGNPALNTNQSLAAIRSNYVSFYYDTIYDEIDLHTNAAGFSFSSATLKNTNTNPNPRATQANIVAYPGAASTQVINSTLDGGATAPGAGGDDGVNSDSGGNDLFAYNLMQNYWDGAIEFTEQDYDETIYENTFRNAGIGSLLFNTHGMVSDSIISWNNFDMTGNFAPAVGPVYGISFASSGTGALLYFQNNNFNNNFFSNGPYSKGATFLTAPNGVNWFVGNNVFYNNYFNYNNYPGIPAPAFTTPYIANVATDWGGNVCAHPNPAGYPLVCH